MANGASNSLRRIRNERGWSQEELALRVGEDVTGATISRLESGRMELTLNWMARIAPALQVQIPDLVTDEMPAVRLIPVIGQISAGSWREAIVEATAQVPVPAHAAGANAFALQPLGDSMDKIVREDGYAIVDPDQRELIAGKVYAFRNEHGETTFKRYAESPPRLEPCSTNEEHKPILLGSEPLVVIGRVVFSIQPIE